MVIIDSSRSPLAARFFAPLAGISDRCPAARSCPKLPDPAWLHLGITRVLEDEPSGRAFLQSLGADRHHVPARSSFFDSLASTRRLRFCREANAALCALMARALPDPLAAWPTLTEITDTVLLVLFPPRRERPEARARRAVRSSQSSRGRRDDHSCSPSSGRLARSTNSLIREGDGAREKISNSCAV